MIHYFPLFARCDNDQGGVRKKEHLKDNKIFKSKKWKI